MLDAPLEEALKEKALKKGGLSLQHRDMLYIRSLGHYINRDFNKCGKDLYQLMEVAPNFWQGWTLYNTVVYRRKKDKVLEGLIFYAATVLVPATISARLHHKA